MADLAKAWSQMRSIVDDATDIGDGVSALVDMCQQHHDWDGWSRVREFDYFEDKQRLERWLKRVLKNQPPTRTIKAFWFGLYNPLVSRKPTSDVYLSGSREFTASETDFEWACGPAYFPNQRYAKSKALRHIYATVSEGGEGIPTLGEYVVCLGYAAIAIKLLASELDSKLWLGTLKQRAVAVGFDSGDGMLLGYLTPDGWQRDVA